MHPGVSLGALVQAGPFLKEHLSGRDFCSFFIVLEKIRDTRTHLPFLWNVIDLIFSSEGILFQFFAIYKRQPGKRGSAANSTSHLKQTII